MDIPAETADGEAWAFPGQGVDPLDTVALLGEHAGDPLLDLLAEATGQASWTARELADTRIAQPCVVVAGILSARTLDPARAAAVVGHSLGEITALTVAGAIEPADALALVTRRAALGHQVQDERPGAMVAVMKLDEATVEWIRRSAVAAAGGSLEVAVVNGPRQFVLSGDRQAAVAAADLAVAEGGVGRLLGIGGAYHSPLLHPAVAGFHAAVAALALKPPSVPFVSSTGGGVVTDVAPIPQVLSRALVMPVRWSAALELVRGLGIHTAVDVGPGRTLVNLAEHDPILAFRGLRPEGRSRPGGR